MTAALLKRVNLDLVMPEFLEKVMNVLATLEQSGCHFYATRGYSSYQEQNMLWARGRTQNADAAGNPLTIVTNSRGGESYHNFGLAMDFAPDSDLVTPGLQPSWKREDFRPLADAMAGAGLEAGFHWKRFVDAPHIQFPLLPMGVKLSTIAKLPGVKDNPKVAWEYIRKCR